MVHSCVFAFFFSFYLLWLFYMGGHWLLLSPVYLFFSFTSFHLYYICIKDYNARRERIIYLLEASGDIWRLSCALNLILYTILHAHTCESIYFQQDLFFITIIHTIYTRSSQSLSISPRISHRLVCLCSYLSERERTSWKLVISCE